MISCSELFWEAIPPSYCWLCNRFREINILNSVPKISCVNVALNTISAVKYVKQLQTQVIIHMLPRRTTASTQKRRPTGCICSNIQGNTSNCKEMSPGKKKNAKGRQKTIDSFHQQENDVSFKVRPCLEPAHVSTATARYQFQESVNSKDHILVLALLDSSFHDVFKGLGRNLKSFKGYVSIFSKYLAAKATNLSM